MIITSESSEVSVTRMGVFLCRSHDPEPSQASQLFEPSDEIEFSQESSYQAADQRNYTSHLPTFPRHRNDIAATPAHELVSLESFDFDLSYTHVSQKRMGFLRPSA